MADFGVELEWGQGGPEGSMALVLINTLGLREECDPVATPATLERWFNEAGLLASGTIPLNISHVRQVRDLRAAAFNCVAAAIMGEELPVSGIEIINRLAALPGFRPQLRDGHRIAEARNPRNAALSHLAADAIVLLALKRGDLRRCPACNRYFVEESGKEWHVPHDATDQCCPAKASK